MTTLVLRCPGSQPYARHRGRVSGTQASALPLQGLTSRWEDEGRGQRLDPQMQSWGAACKPLSPRKPETPTTQTRELRF